MRVSSVRAIGSWFVVVGSSIVSTRDAAAQFGNAWLELTWQLDALLTPTGGTADLVFNADEKNFAVSDLNRDGWPDLLVVKSAPSTLVGPREGRLFVNEKGKLVDRTATHGIQSLSAGLGDLGFKQAVEAGDVEVGDLDGDGWDDVVSVQYDLANNTSPAAKRLTHPRTYMNLGADAFGTWLGIRHEDARIPQLMTVGGLAGVVRFMDGSLGDVDLDGDLDIHLVDFDEDMHSHPEQPNGPTDLNDRLLINDGNGYFVDETVLRFNHPTMSWSYFGSQSLLVDVNGDGRIDVVKCHRLSKSDHRVDVLYNDLIQGVLPDFLGGFDQVDWIDDGNGFYSVTFTDLNNDGRLDIAIGDIAADRFRINLGIDSIGRVIWSGAYPFLWLTGSSDDGALGSIHGRDYDLDGWNDVLTTDVDPALNPVCNRRPKIYHNLGGVPGATNIVLIEEKEQSGTGGWFGVVGWNSQNPRGVFDAANLDYDRDGDIDLILGGCLLTQVWRNETNPIVCQSTIGLSSLGNATLSMCGAPLHSGLTSKLAIANGPPGGLAVLLASMTSTTIPIFGGQVLLPFQFSTQLPLWAGGGIEVTVPGGAGTPDGLHVYVQAVLLPAAGGPPTHLTNILDVELLD